MAALGHPIYLGAGTHGWVCAGPQHAALVLGPPRSGKTSAIVIPAVLAADGSVVSTSTKPDVLGATAAARGRMGRCWLFDPTGTVEPPPKGGSPDALAAAWTRVLALAARQREEDIVAPSERYSVEQRTAEIEALFQTTGRVTFAELLGDDPSLGFAIVTFIALLDLYRRSVIDIAQDELFGEITVLRRGPGAEREARGPGTP